MKSFICAFLFSALVVVSIHAAAVEPVVEEVKLDVSPAAATAAPESELMTNEDCHQPKETGRCFALFYRFAFDVEKRECVEFIYGGCAGNSNNFESKEDCEKKCMQKSEELAAEDATNSATTVMPENAEEPKDLTTTQPETSVSESS